VADFSNTPPPPGRYHERMKITPVLIVEKVEASLEFWGARMGFVKTVDVPAEDGLSFAILVKDGAEVMLQSRASALRDEPKFANHSRSALFVEVEDLEDVKKRLEGYPIAMPERTTFYGTNEIGVFEPGGHTVIFAAKTA
jgi:uncharacterized glyoxalase superfamily protein PhnB